MPSGLIGSKLFWGSAIPPRTVWYSAYSDAPRGTRTLNESMPPEKKQADERPMPGRVGGGGGDIAGDFQVQQRIQDGQRTDGSTVELAQESAAGDSVRHNGRELFENGEFG